MARATRLAGALDQYDRVLHALYEAAIDGTQWESALAELVRYIGNSGTHMFFTDVRTGLVNQDVYVGMPDMLMDDYNQHMVLQCPKIKAAREHPERTIVYDYQHIDERGIDHSEYYHWLQTRGDGIRYYLGMRFFSDDRSFSGLSLAFRRSEGHCQQRHIQRLERLVPHIQRSARISQKFGQYLSVEKSFEVVAEQLQFGLMALNQRRQVMYANSLARQWMIAGKLLSVVECHIELKDLEANRMFQGVLAALEHPDDLLVKGTGGSIAARASDGTSYRVGVATVPAGLHHVGQECVRTVVTLTPMPRRAQATLPGSLTAAERALAEGLAAGKSLEELARSRGVSIHTVRSQLKTIMSKVGVHRQAELVAAVLGRT